MASWENEIASLDRVLTRLALTEEAQLEKVLLDCLCTYRFTQPRNALC